MFSGRISTCWVGTWRTSVHHGFIYKITVLFYHPLAPLQVPRGGGEVKLPSLVVFSFALPLVVALLGPYRLDRAWTERVIKTDGADSMISFSCSLVEDKEIHYQL